MSLFLQCMPKPISKTLENKSNGEDLFNNLPQDIIIEILSKLPTKTILSCKLVCKSWRDLSKRTQASCIAMGAGHLSNSPMPYKIFRFADKKFAAEILPLSNNWPSRKKPTFRSSVNGLLFLLEESAFSDYLFICNPITCEYIKIRLRHPRPIGTRVYGFGVTKISGEYKLVMMIIRKGFPRRTCQVYTLGTGRWRTIAPCNRLEYDYIFYNYGIPGVFVNGNLHWLVNDSENKRLWISCLDLETERFTSFSPPLDIPRDYSDSCRFPWLYASRGRLCLYNNNNSHTDEFAMWSMKEYGDEKSWTKEINITTARWSRFFPVKDLEDGEILFAETGSRKLLCYSNVTKDMQKSWRFEVSHFPDRNRNIVSFTPSFVSLKSRLRMENVVSF